jgi:hypothetical protein
MSKRTVQFPRRFIVALEDHRHYIALEVASPAPKIDHIANLDHRRGCTSSPASTI